MAAWPALALAWELASPAASLQQSVVYRLAIRSILLAATAQVFPGTAAASTGGVDAPATAPSRITDVALRRVSDLSRRAADLIDQHKFLQARHTLQEALKLSPDNSTCLYNLALVDAELRAPDRAMDDLERATEAGFTDFAHLESAAAFRPLHDRPRYQKLLSRRGQIRHHAAERSVAQLRDQFGPHYLYAMDEPHKRVFAVHLGQAALADLREELDTEAASEESEIFSHPPDEFIRIVVASGADFARLEHRPGVGGRYDDSTRTVLVKRIGPELRHEFTHALHAADQHAIDQEHPVWLSEGLATLYEYPHIEGRGDGQRMFPADTWRLARVQAAARHDALIPLEHLFKMDRAGFTARADLAYGESGSLLLYLYEHGLLKKFYEAYTAGYAADPTGHSALEQTTDLAIPELQTEWIEWLLPRPVPPRNAAEPGE